MGELAHWLKIATNQILQNASNVWCFPNSLSIGFGPAMKTHSSRWFKRHPTAYMWFPNWLPFYCGLIIVPVFMAGPENMLWLSLVFIEDSRVVSVFFRIDTGLVYNQWGNLTNISAVNRFELVRTNRPTRTPGGRRGDAPDPSLPSLVSQPISTGLGNLHGAAMLTNPG